MSRRSVVSDILILAACLALCFGAAAIGGAWTSSSLPDWYAGLRKPSWNPPGWVFGPVWSVLYFLMAIAAAKVWRVEGWTRRGSAALGLFLVQLALNVAWSGIFFGLHRPGLAFAEILLLWLAIAATIAAFRRIDRIAALLLVPYLAWVTFAGVLNATIWRMNA